MLHAVQQSVLTLGIHLLVRHSYPLPLHVFHQKSNLADPRVLAVLERVARNALDLILSAAHSGATGPATDVPGGVAGVVKGGGGHVALVGVPEGVGQRGEDGGEIEEEEEG